MPTIAYLDLETDTHTNKILDIGLIVGDTMLHTANFAQAITHLKTADYICGHNFLHHDYHYIKADLASLNKSPKILLILCIYPPYYFPQNLITP